MRSTVLAMSADVKIVLLAGIAAVAGSAVVVCGCATADLLPGPTGRAVRGRPGRVAASARAPGSPWAAYHSRRGASVAAPPVRRGETPAVRGAPPPGIGGPRVAVGGRAGGRPPFGRRVVAE